MREFAASGMAGQTEIIARRTEQQPKHKAAEQLGDIGLLGFTLMEAMESQWEDVREVLNARIVDQPAAIDAIIDALDSSEARMLDDHQPIATFAFLGPTGVGKSETGKTLAMALAGGQDNLIKIDCSNYSQGHEVAGLTGSPVGYIGYGQDPVFEKEAVEKDHVVVLFDEIEKGSPALYDLMLQIMEDGKLRLSSGDIVSFRNAILILTSNLGAKEMAKQVNTMNLGFTTPKQAPASPEDIERVATREFESFFRPEFVNRLDKMVVFHPLSANGLGKVLDAKLDVINKEYEARYGTRLTLSDATKQHLVAEAAEQPHMGARPLVRAFKKHVQSQFGRYLGMGQIREGTEVRVLHPSEVGADYQAGSPLVFGSVPNASLKRKMTRALVPRDVEFSEDELEPEER